MASLVPEAARSADELHFVLCDFGKFGRAFVETDPARAVRESVVEDIVSGELRRPVKVLVLHPEGTWRDVSVEIAWAVTEAATAAGDLLAGGTRDFVIKQLGDRAAYPYVAA